MIAHLQQRQALAQQPVSLPKFANNLLRRVMPALDLVLLTLSLTLLVAIFTFGIRI